MPATRLWVGNVPYASTQDELETLFLQYGKISNVNFREGFSFIDFENEEDAHTAKTKLHETIYQGRRLQVEFARSDGPRPRVDRDRANDLPPSGDASDGSRHLYVARIPEAVTLDELRDFFARHGNGRALIATGVCVLGPSIGAHSCAPRGAHAWVHGPRGLGCS